MREPVRSSAVKGVLILLGVAASAAIAVSVVRRAPPRPERADPTADLRREVAPPGPAPRLPEASLDPVAREKAFVEERVAGERRGLSVVSAALEKAEHDPGVDRAYLTSLRELKATYQARMAPGQGRADDAKK